MQLSDGVIRTSMTPDAHLFARSTHGRNGMKVLVMWHARLCGAALALHAVVSMELTYGAAASATAPGGATAPAPRKAAAEAAAGAGACPGLPSPAASMDCMRLLCEAKKATLCCFIHSELLIMVCIWHACVGMSDSGREARYLMQLRASISASQWPLLKDRRMSLTAWPPSWYWWLHVPARHAMHLLSVGG